VEILKHSNDSASIRGIAYPSWGNKKLNAKGYTDALLLANELEALGTKNIDKQKLITGMLAGQISLLPYMTQLKGAEGSSLLTTSRALLALLGYSFLVKLAPK
jgi:hypothetical protein